MLELDYRAKVILLALLDYGPRAFPRQSTLARKVGMGRTALQANIDRLRAAGLLATRGTGKALSYVVLPGIRAATCPESGPVMPGIRASDARNPGRDPNYSIELKNPPAAAKPPEGWGDVSDHVKADIRRRDDGADVVVAAQQAVVLDALAGVGITAERDRAEAWHALCVRWAREGAPARPYNVVKQAIQSVQGSRDVQNVRAVVMHRLRGAA